MGLTKEQIALGLDIESKLGRTLTAQEIVLLEKGLLVMPYKPTPVIRVHGGPAPPGGKGENPQQAAQEEIAILEHDIAVLKGSSMESRIPIRRHWIALLRAGDWGGYRRSRELDSLAGRTLLLRMLIAAGDVVHVAGHLGR